jgi:type I restriction enzyme, S subunit
MSFPRYPQYKDSGVDWLREVPGHWETAPLKTVTTHNDDVLDETTAADFEISYVDISSVDGLNGIKDKETMLFSNAPSRARRRVKHGDVIVSTVRTYLKAIARIRDSEENLVVSTGFAVIRPCGGLAPDFLGCLVSAGYFVDQVIARSTGVSYPAINASDLVGIPVPVPPLAEQTQIAAFLDRETAKIDDLVAQQRRLMELLKEKRQAVISHAVTQGLNPQAPMKPSGIEWLGDVPAHWATPAMYMRYSSELGKMLDSVKITGKHLIPYMRNVDVQWGAINFDELPEMDIHEDEYERYIVKTGDLLVCEGGEVGRAAIVPPVSAIFGYQKALHRLRALDTSEDSSFMYFTLLWAANTGIFNQSGSSTIAHLTGEQLRKYRFPKPPIVEQRKIAAHLVSESAKFDTLTTEAQRAIDLLQERRTALISAAVTGQIDVREAA